MDKELELRVKEYNNNYKKRQKSITKQKLRYRYMRMK